MIVLLAAGSRPTLTANPFVQIQTMTAYIGQAVDGEASRGSLTYLSIFAVGSLLFLMKNLDADNISNARIMNRGTDRNIMTQLGMTSDEYNLLNVLYYVRDPLFRMLFGGTSATD
jgi:hypothetical protein